MSENTNLSSQSRDLTSPQSLERVPKMPPHELGLLMPDSAEKWVHDAKDLWPKNKIRELPEDSKKIIQHESNQR